MNIKFRDKLHGASSRSCQPMHMSIKSSISFDYANFFPCTLNMDVEFESSSRIFFHADSCERVHSHRLAFHSVYIVAVANTRNRFGPFGSWVSCLHISYNNAHVL